MLGAMSQSDFNSGFSDFGPGDEVIAPERTSLLAVGSLIVSIISLVACCVPGPGVLGVVMGVAALPGISRSQGRVGGKGMAITGIVIGLIATLVSLLLWFGGAMGWSQAAARFDGVFDPDPNVTRAMMARAYTNAFTDEDHALFLAEVESEWGAFRGTDRGLASALGRYFSEGQSLQVVGNAPPSYHSRMWPMPAEFDSGSAFVIAIMVQGQNAPDGFPAFENVGVVSRDGSRIIWLIDPVTTPTAPTTPTPPPADTPADPGDDDNAG